MPQIGSFTLLLALALAAYSFVAGVLALYRKDDRLSETARRAGIACWAAVTVAAFALVMAAFGNDFSVAYILHHSNRDLPIAYKFAALWSGQEGSLLLWAWLLSTYGLVMRLRYKVDPQLTAYASAIVAAVQVFFLLLVNFAAHPFGLVKGTIPPDGNGLNPLLQYPEMVIHPPMLYLGYVGVTAPFAFALGALIMKYPGEKWIHITRRWTMVAWLFLTCGVFLGAHWAYAVLGWGGYWGWDPVENASILPWLTMTAFLHSVMMQEKRGMMKMWNMWLIFTTFLLAIFGTFLTRSGVVSSVHAFAQSGIGIWFVWFLAISFATCVFFFVRNRDTLKSEHRLDSLVSRESSFLFNNLVLLVACFAVLWGTLFPVLSEWVTGSKVTVGPPFFNRVNVPIGLFLVFLTGVGPLLAWRQTSSDSLRRNFLVADSIDGGGGSRADRGRHAAVARQRVFLFADGDLAVGVRGGNGCRRVLARRTCHCAAAAHQHPRGNGADHPAQYSPLRRIPGSLRGRAGDYRLRRSAVQSGQRAGTGLRRQDADRRLHIGVPVVHARRQAKLQQRVGRARRLQRRQEDRHHVSRAALLQGQRADLDHRGQPLAAERRLVPGIHRAGILIPASRSSRRT